MGVKTVAGSSSVVNMELYHSDNETEWNNFKAGRAYLEGEKELMLGMLSSMVASQVWQLAATYLGISLGLLMFGKRVIMTMGSKITPMTPSLGFIVVLSASLVVMICSFLGIPTSTTHCQVMAVVGGGIARGMIDTNSVAGGFKTVDMKVFRNIGLSWIVTIPASMAISAGLYAVLRVSIIGPFS